jgi:hypothetical protein
MDPTRRNLLASSGVLLALGGASPLLAEQATPTATRKTPGRTKTDTTRDPFAQLAYQRAQQDQSYAGVKNVLDYGAVGDGVADDTAAIQAAIDDQSGGCSLWRRGTIYFPNGHYKITSPLNYGYNIREIRFLGAAGAEIAGTFNGFIFTRAGTSPDYTSMSFEHLRIFNNSNVAVTSGCINCDGVIGLKVTACRIGATGGIGISCGSAQDVTVDTCTMGGGGINSTSLGVMAGNGCAVIDSDFHGWGNALRFNNIGLNVIGGRWEVNGTAIRIGVDINGGFSSASAVFISGLSMESNNVHIRGDNVAGASFQGVGMTSFNAGNTHGIWITNGHHITIDSCGAGGTAYSVAGIAIDMESLDHQIDNITIKNTTSTSWFVTDRVDTTSWVNTDYTPAFTNRYNKRIYIPPNRTIAPLTATIASGAITVNGNYMVIDTQDATTSDELDNISGAQRGSHGSRLVLRAANSARTVVVKDGTGNLRLAGDFSLDNEQDTITLIFDSALDLWLEIGRSDNGA